MRLDRYLKNVGIVKRRTLAKRLSDEGNVNVNGRKAKPSTDVAVGDRIRVQIGMQIAEYEVLNIAERPIAKSKREDHARLLSSERVGPLDEM
jgi:ribosomal 50S subunit-recycling heat shock protein